MIKNSTKEQLNGTYKRLNSHNITIYKISKIILENESIVHKIFKGKADSFTDDKVNSILEKINTYLDELERKDVQSEIESKIKIPSMEDCPEIFDNHELYTRLFEIGLNSNKFNPEEKLHFAIWHRALREFKKQKNLNKPKEEN